MNKILNLGLLMALLFSFGCSLGKKSSSDDLYADDDFFSDADFLVTGDDDFFLDSDMDFDPLFADEAMDMDGFMETQPVISGSSFSGGIGEYHVKSGDTLLLIAFNLYGDYSRWRDISRLNNGKMHISPGDVLQYEIPAQPFVWNPRGNPHLIRKGETLGTISRDKYGTPARWRDLYDNNRPMIKDPNLIFAGFTLYYIPGRDLASEGRL